MGLFNRSPRTARKTKRQSQQQHVTGFEPLENRQFLSVSVAEPAGDQFLVNTYTTSYQMTDWRGQAADSDADGDSVVVWMSEGQDGSGYGAYGQRYDKNGAKAGGEFRISTATGSDQSYPNVAMADNGDFVVAWSSYFQDGSGWGVYARRYAADGTARGGEFRVNTTTLSDQLYTSVAADASGDFVVAWTAPTGQ
jgi:hypothetical protein